MAESSGSFFKVDPATGDVSLSSELYGNELRVNTPLDTADLPTDPATADPIPGTTRVQDGTFVYQQRWGYFPDGSWGKGWAIVGKWLPASSERNAPQRPAEETPAPKLTAPAPAAPQPVPAKPAVQAPKLAPAPRVNPKPAAPKPPGKPAATLTLDIDSTATSRVIRARSKGIAAQDATVKLTGNGLDLELKSWRQDDDTLAFVIPYVPFQGLGISYPAQFTVTATSGKQALDAALTITGISEMIGRDSRLAGQFRQGNTVTVTGPGLGLAAKINADAAFVDPDFSHARARITVLDDNTVRFVCPTLGISAFPYLCDVNFASAGKPHWQWQVGITG